MDNLVFISITTNRLPPEKQHIGRKLGLAGALVMRILFLCFASYLVHMTASLFTVNLGAYSHGFSVRDIVMLVGGGYLIYKGISELIDVLALTEIKAETSEEHKARHLIGLPQAVGTIMVMDLVFSIDSVITAVGLAEHLIVMILAVMIAVFIMMIFIDPISNFINSHPEMKILALVFICAIGVLLVLVRRHPHLHRGARHAHGEAHGVLRHDLRGRLGVHSNGLQFAAERVEEAAGRRGHRGGGARGRGRRGAGEGGGAGPCPRGRGHRERRAAQLAARLRKDAPGGRLRTSLEFLEIRACIVWLLPL